MGNKKRAKIGGKKKLFDKRTPLYLASDFNFLTRGPIPLYHKHT